MNARRWVHDQWVTLRTTTRTQWVMFLIGNVLIAVGIGAGILASAFGAGPLDAVFAGAANVTPLTVGTWVILLSAALVAFAWALGTPPLLGTVLSFFILGIGIDVSLTLAPTVSSVPGQIVQWLIGAILLAVGAGLTIASHVGASAYDMATVAVSKFFAGRLGLARLALDVTALIVAFIIGGPIAWGTLGLMVVFPLIMPRVVRWASRLLPAAAPQL